MNRGLGAVVVAGVAALVLLGCDGDPAPTTTITPGGGTSSPVVTSSALATAPVLPPAALTADSANAFIKYYLDTYNYAFSTHDVGPLKAASQTTCNFCASAIEGVAQDVREGIVNHGGQLSLVGAFSPPQKLVSGTLVTAFVRQQPGTSDDGTGRSSSTKGFRSLKAIFALAWANQRWFVHGVDFDKATEVPW